MRFLQPPWPDLSRFARKQFGGVDSQSTHSLADCRPFLANELLALAAFQPSGSTRGNEHANPALYDDETFVLEALVSLGDGQRVGAFFGRERTDGRQRVPVLESTSDDGVADDLAEADVNGLFVGVSQRHAVVIQHGAKSCNAPNVYTAVGGSQKEA